MALQPPKKKYEDGPVHPAQLTQGVCADVMPLGYKVAPNTKKGGVLEAREKIVFVFQSSVFKPGGVERYELTREFTYSAAPGGFLLPWLNGWRGTNFTSDAEAVAALPLLDEWGIGRNALMTVTHSPNPQGGVWVNIGNVSPLLPGMPDLQVVGYRRAPYWAEKTAKYAEGFAVWEQTKLTQRVQGDVHAAALKSPGPVGSLHDRPAALDDGPDDDLPF